MADAPFAKHFVFRHESVHHAVDPGVGRQVAHGLAILHFLKPFRAVKTEGRGKARMGDVHQQLGRFQGPIILIQHHGTVLGRKDVSAQHEQNGQVELFIARGLVQEGPVGAGLLLDGRTYREILVACRGQGKSEIGQYVFPIVFDESGRFVGNAVNLALFPHRLENVRAEAARVHAPRQIDGNVRGEEILDETIVYQQHVGLGITGRNGHPHFLGILVARGGRGLQGNVRIGLLEAGIVEDVLVGVH